MTKSRMTSRLALASAAVLAMTMSAPAVGAAAETRPQVEDNAPSGFTDGELFAHDCRSPWTMQPWISYGSYSVTPLQTDLIVETNRPAAGGFRVTVEDEVPTDHYEIEQQTSYRVIVHLRLDRSDLNPEVRLDWTGIIMGNEFPTTVSVEGPALDGEGKPTRRAKITAQWFNEPVDCLHGGTKFEYVS
jgi:hypothetical protein